MLTRSRNKVVKGKVGNVTFRSPIGFEAMQNDNVDRDIADKGYAKDDDSDENGGDESENSRESTPMLDDPSSFLTRNSPLRNTSTEPEDKIKLAQVGEDEHISKDLRHRERRRDQQYSYIPESNTPENAQHYTYTPQSNRPGKAQRYTLIPECGIPEIVQPLHGEIKNSGWTCMVVLTVVLLVLGLLFGHQLIKQHEEEPQPFDVNDVYLSKKDLKLEESLDNIRERFPSQDDAVWYTFSAGIKSITVEKPNKPSVFLMLYEYNGKTPACLANEVSKLAISYIMGQNTMPVIVDGVQLKEDKALNEDAGELIVRYNKTVQNRGSLIVTNLHEVPANIAKSFHFFCDSYTPLIERAAYFFTLSTQGERLPKNKLQHVAERTMRNLWSDSLKDHRLEPLITRLSGYVIRIVPESKMDGCD